MSFLPRLGDEDEGLTPENLAFLERALEEPLAKHIQYLSVVLPAPIEAPEKFLRLVPRDMAYCWRSPTRTMLAGGGCTARLTAYGEDRFARLRDAAHELFPRIAVRTAPGVEDYAPTIFGGAAFTPGVAPFEPWEEFVEDVFTLPRFGYRRKGQSAFFSVNLTRDELAAPGARKQIVDEVRALLRALETESPTSMIERVDLGRSSVHHLSRGDWSDYIDAIRAAFASGSYDKIVAARRCVVDLSRPLEDTGFMARLFAAYPGCTHFALRRKQSTFLGATPETLFHKHGVELTTHALAGTKRVADDPSSDSSSDVAALRSSRKDLGEHTLVVKKICEELMPLSKRIRYTSAPNAKTVRNLVHLETPISAELRPEIHAFDLIERLHPTPAVGGFPAKEAAQWIRQNEPLERGWYTGTLGWFDANGDAEFAVAIRCGVLTPRRAYIFAGAGIVPQSSADAEYEETGSKMSPILRALGVPV